MTPGLGQAAEEALRRCVHCGFCLPACPTYRELGDELDSPRGRIQLMQGLLAGTVDPGDPDLEQHLALCLDCRACETACPSGVAYGRILEAARSRLGPSPRARRLVRVLGHLLGRPGRLAHLRTPLALAQRRRLLGPLARRLAGPVAGRLGESLPPLPRRGAGPLLALPAGDGPEPPEGTVQLFLGCIQDLVLARVNWATGAVLRRWGVAVQVPAGQGCCGALHAHAGDRETARGLARQVIDRFTGSEPVVVNAAGCGSAMKEYGALLADDPTYAARARAFAARVRDFSEVAASLAFPAPPRRISGPVAYDAPCHLVHGQRLREPPLQLLDRLGVDLRPLEESEVCCGSAGTYNLVEPELAERLLARKMHHVRRSGARWLVTANPGCQLWLGVGVREAGQGTAVLHLAELAAAAFGLTPPEALGGGPWPTD